MIVRSHPTFASWFKLISWLRLVRPAPRQEGTHSTLCLRLAFNCISPSPFPLFLLQLGLIWSWLGAASFSYIIICFVFKMVSLPASVIINKRCSLARLIPPEKFFWEMILIERSRQDTAIKLIPLPSLWVRVPICLSVRLVYWLHVSSPVQSLSLIDWSISNSNFPNTVHKNRKPYWPVSDYSSSPEGKLTKVVYILERAYGVWVVGICFGLTVPVQTRHPPPYFPSLLCNNWNSLRAL